MLAAMVESWDVIVPAADAVVVLIARPKELRQVAAHVDHLLLGKVAPDLIGAVANPVRENIGLGVQQNARRVHGGSAEHDDTATHLSLRARVAVKILDTRSSAAIVG